jgi:hypothetical protein
MQLDISARTKPVTAQTERSSLSIEAFDAVAPILLLDRSISSLSDQLGEYLIWGGVAANLLLMAMGRTHIFYSLHDIEFLRIAHDRIAPVPERATHISFPLPGDRLASLPIGGTRIPTTCYGLAVADFQSRRIAMCDGDLYLNNIGIAVERSAGRLDIYCPVGTIDMLRSGGHVDAKPHTSLDVPERISRRVTRSIAKATRLWQVANLPASTSLCVTQQELITRFLSVFTASDGADTSRLGSSYEWATEHAIDDLPSAGQWLFDTAVAETIKRLAVLYLSDGHDVESFNSFLDEAVSVLVVENVSLLSEAKLLIERITRQRINVLGDATRLRCYNDFKGYHCEDVDLLSGLLSRQGKSLYGNRISEMFPTIKR